ncbi:uncharacterized protein [Apostichopus japonicus]|uniref:uncharacterized protein isoform X2 n=1 Tax=Stichopus japonicus TaxID=307972 RepID=UPI003AB83608
MGLNDRPLRSVQTYLQQCTTAERNFEDKSCYELLTQAEAESSGALAGLEDGTAHCQDNGYRLPHIGSRSELDFLNQLHMDRYGETGYKCFMYGSCTGIINEDGTSQCFWDGWSSSTVRYVGTPSWAELKVQTCAVNCIGLCTTFEDDGSTSFIACRADSAYTKPVYCERPITYECYSDGDCVYGYCEVGRCRCASDADCTNVGENCFHGGCIGDDPVSTMGPTTTVNPTTTESETTMITTTDPTTTEAVTTMITTTDPTTTEAVTTMITTTDPTTTEAVTTMITTTDPTTTEAVTTMITTTDPTTTEAVTTMITTTDPTTTEAVTTMITTTDPTTTEAVTTMITTTDPTTTEAVTTMITTTDPTTTEAVTTMLTTTDPTTTEAVTTMITTTDPTTTEAVTTMLTTTDPTTTEAVTTMLTMTDPATTEMWTTKQMTTDPTTKMTTTEAATTKVTTKGPSTTEMLTTKMTTIGQTSTEAVTSGGTTDVTTTEQMTTNISTKPVTTSMMTTTNQTSTTGPQTTDTPSTSQADTSPGLTTATPLITDGISCATFPEVITFKSSCYVVANTKRNVTMARRYCHVTYNGYLVTIESSQEQEFLAAHVAGFNDYWIGLSYRSGNRTFHVSGSTGTYLNQLAAQPPYSLNASNICFAMDRINNFFWSPFVCNDTKYFICEIDNLDYVRVTTDMTTTEDVTTTIGVTTIATTDETTVEPTTTVVATTTEEMTTDMTTTEATTTAGFSGCEAEPCLNGATCQELQSDFVCKCEIGFGGVLCEEDLTPDFDPTLSQVIQIEDLLPDGQLLINPYYALGLYHIPLLVTTDDLSEDLHQYENIIHLLNMNVREVKGRRGLGSYPVWIGRSSQLRFLWDTNPINGLSCFDDCSEGFAVSVWLRILATKSEGSDPEHIFEIDSPNFVAYAVIAEGSDILLHVSLSSGYKIQRRLLGPDLPEGWFNLGLTWHPDVELESYINGRPADALEYDALINSFSTDTPSVSVCDFTVWDRYVHQFEVHSFLGMDADQFRMMTTADYYWSLDAYVRRDHYVLTNSTDVVAMTTPIETADRDSRKVVPDRNGKGYALEIGDQDDQWLQLGSHEGTCLSNPELCVDGLTIGMWLRLTAPSDKEFHCVFSSGAQSSRGVALYQFGDKLRAVLVDGGREWITEISMENVSSWVHLAISWKKSDGMFFYLDGDLKAGDWVGVRRIRPTDLDFGFTIGRRNDFLGDFAQVTVAEVAVWYHVVRPWQARETFGFPENPYFSEALVSWDAKKLFNGGFSLLSSLRRTQYYQSFTSGVTYDVRENCVALSTDSATITLAVPSILPELQCLGDIDQCVDGFGLSLWLFVEEEVKFWWSKGILQIISGREGFSVQLTQQGLFVSLSLNSIRRDYMVSVLNVPVKEWFNLVVTWSQYEDLAVYINGKVMTFDSIAEDTSQDLGSDIFFIQSNQFNVVVKIHSIAAWDKYVYPKKIWQLVGVSESALSCLHLGAHCWPFDAPIDLKFPYQLSPTGVQKVDNQFLDGDALVTDNSDTGEIVLGDFTGRCPHIPSLCENGFSVSFWLRPVKITSKRVAHLVGLGADVAGEVGFTISQSRQTITAMVSNGTRTWQGTVPAVNITYDEWMYLALLWLPQDGMLLVLDGQVVSSESKPIDDVRESEMIGTLVLGGRSRTKRLEATFDEFMLLTPTGSDKLPSAEYYTGSGGLVEGYSSADSYFDVTDPEGSVEAVDTVLTQDRFQNEEGAADTAKNEVKDFGYVTVGDFPFHCLSDPAMCHPAGLTISLWIKMGSTDHFQNPATNSEGVGYILSSGAQTSTSHGYSAHFNNSHISTTVVDGTNIWSTSFKYTFGSNWTNYALGWNQRDGLNVFIGGEVKGSNVSGVVLPVVRPSDEFTQLQLGKRNDAEDGYLGAAFDDVAIWIYTFSPDDPELSKTLKGEETKEEEIEVTEDHEELLKVAPLTWKADCQVIHEADCARNVNELLEIVQEQEELTLNATKSIYDRLLNLTSGKTLPDSSDIKASIHVMDEMSKAGLPSGLARNEAMNIYESFAESVSNLLEDDLYPLWQNISENEYSVAALMENLETLGIQVATRLPVNKEYTGCSTVFKKARLVTCMDRFPIDTFGLTDTVLPPVVDLGSNDTSTNNSELLRIDDTIRLPANLFRYTNGGDAATFVFSHFDNLQDVLTSNMSDQLAVQYTGQAVANSRIISLAIDPPLRRDLYNPVIITLRTHQQYDNETVDTVCAFWNFTANMGARGWWDTGGCELISSNDTHITCSCNHLTHFAVVSSSIIPIVPNPHHATIAVMGLGLFCVNLFFLGHLVFTLIRHRRLHTLRNTIHLQECLSVFALGLSLVVATMGRNSEGLCQLSAIALQYAALSVLIWIVIEALQLSEDSYRGLHVTDKKHFSRCDDRLKIYYSTGWGLPVLVVATTVAGGTNPHLEIGSGICFLSPLHGAMWAFYAPFIIGILSSVLLLLVVARYYDIHIKRQDRVHSFRSSLRATCILTAYYFVAWIIGYKGLYGEAIWIQYIFVFLLTSLGLVLYLVHGIGNTEIRALLFCEDPDVALTEVQEIYIIPEEEMELPPRPIYKS